jgi:hypothetical protein
MVMRFTHYAKFLLGQVPIAPFDDPEKMFASSHFLWVGMVFQLVIAAKQFYNWPHKIDTYPIYSGKGIRKMGPECLLILLEALRSGKVKIRQVSSEGEI